MKKHLVNIIGALILVTNSIGQTTNVAQDKGSVWEINLMKLKDSTELES